MKVIFYEKPGCSGNAKQKKLLGFYGVAFETRSILTTPWSEDGLNSFFDGLEKENIINKFAPKVKSGELNISDYSKDELVKLMVQEPILIKRPLLVLGDKKVCGFDVEKINNILNKNICENVSISTCAVSVSEEVPLGCQSSVPCKSI